MRFTRAGIGLLVVAGLSLVLGRTFGVPELFLLAGMGFVALIAAIIATLSARLELSVLRVASPNRLRVGTPARVDLSLQNQSRRRTPVLHLRDEVQNSSGASLILAPIKGKETAKVAYRLPTQQRGALSIGPLDLRIGDPLGLTTSLIRASDQVSLVVHTELVDLGALHSSAGNDPTADQQPIRSLASGGDEFFALRPYVVGDELRRVHWRASARSDELVVKQEERPRTGRVTVILDRRSEAYSDAGFERAVSATLSVLYAGWRGDDALRYVTSGSGTFADIRSRAELDAIDEQLAIVQRTQSASLVRTIDETTRIGRGGTLVVITGQPGSEFEPSLAIARRTYGQVITIVCESGIVAPSADWILHDGASPLPVAWSKAVVNPLVSRGSVASASAYRFRPSRGSVKR